MLIRLVRAATAALVLLVPSGVPHAQDCVLEYQRADNMWAAFGRPDGALGTESIALHAGENRVFVTDWKYEKTRNDGTNFYGSHLRLATSKGRIPVNVEVVSATATVESMLGDLRDMLQKLAWNRALVGSKLGSTRPYRADLAVVRCPKA
jgi:hypothetical protein